MSIAASTLLLFLLLIPGMAFRACFNFGVLSKKSSKYSAFDDYIMAIIPGLGAQLLAAVIINFFEPFGYFVDFSAMGSLIFGEQKSSSGAFSTLQKTLYPVFFYNVTLIGLAASVGFFTRRLVRYFHLDHKHRHWRFTNEWFYILRGEFIFFKENKVLLSSVVLSKKKAKGLFKRRKIWLKWIFNRLLKIRKGKLKIVQFYRRHKIVTCSVHAVVKSDAGSCYIYSGTIHSFYLAKDGTLETLLLKGARRRAFTDDAEKKYYIIPTDVVVLKNSEIVSISVNALPINEISVTQKDVDPGLDDPDEPSDPDQPPDPTPHPYQTYTYLPIFQGADLHFPWEEK